MNSVMKGLMGQCRLQNFWARTAPLLVSTPVVVIMFVYIVLSHYGGVGEIDSTIAAWHKSTFSQFTKCLKTK